MIKRKEVCKDRGLIITKMWIMIYSKGNVKFFTCIIFQEVREVIIVKSATVNKRFFVDVK